MKLSNKDHLVIRAFTEQRTARGDKLDTDGARLDGSWMGGSKIAYWVGDQIFFSDLGSRAAESVKKAVIAEAAPNTVPTGITLQDKHRGQIHLVVRRGIVTGAMGSDPERFVGKTIEEAQRIAKSSAKQKLIRVGSRCFKV